MKDLLQSPLLKQLKEGTLPEIKVEATLSRETVVNLVIGAMIVIVFGVIVIRLSK